MKLRAVALSIACVGCVAAGAALGQGAPAASRGLQISVFGGPTGNFTGLANGHNFSITAGVDIGIRPFYGLLPAVEVRGLYPVKDGTTDSQKNVVAGVRLEKRYRALRLYGDALFGRGAIDYLSGGYPDPAGNFLYTSSTSSVFSPGVGASYDFTPHFSFFADAQFQRYDTPTTVSGHLWSKPVTLGMTYRLPFLRHGRPYP